MVRERKKLSDVAVEKVATANAQSAPKCAMMSAIVIAVFEEEREESRNENGNLSVTVSRRFGNNRTYLVTYLTHFSNLIFDIQGISESEEDGSIRI